MSKNLQTRSGQIIHIQNNSTKDIQNILLENRNISEGNKKKFFSPTIEDLEDPFLMPDMEKAVRRILMAREKKERIVIFGDYDVDGVSSTAILVRFLSEIGCSVSYRLPHRVHDGYGLKGYFFDELKEKRVSLVITVDCGTRDVEAIKYAAILGINVIVTDHHAVPEIIPEEVVALLNPKRGDSLYPFPSLAGAGVAYKLLHGILISLLSKEKDETLFGDDGKNKEAIFEKILMQYIDLASLGTVADCMPLTGENRTITTLGLKQMKNSQSAGLRKFLSEKESATGDADIIGFQIGPRINASGRMDTPLTALRWLLASEERCDEFLSEIEELNERRKEIVKSFAEKALLDADPEDGVLFFVDKKYGNIQKQEVQGIEDFSKGTYSDVNDQEKSDNDDEIRSFSEFPKLEHGLIGVVAGKLTEMYHLPSIVLCESHGNTREKKREYEKTEIQSTDSHIQLVASCRSPEWCNLVELLDECKHFFVRYGGHRQAAGFTIEAEKYDAFRLFITQKFREKYGHTNLPKKMINVEAIIDPSEVHLENLNLIHQFRPFGIGNPKPLWMIENLTISEVNLIGKEKNHLSLKFLEIGEVKALLWNFSSIFPNGIPSIGEVISPIFELEKNEWNGKESIQIMIRDLLS